MVPKPSRQQTVFDWLYNHNPFYVISAVLMLYAVRDGYGELKIGEIDCWLMMGVLAGYTSVLAVVSVLIVRWGKVWEDARSLLLLLLLLFLAVSISADDLFANMESSTGGTLLMVSGYLFSAIVTELVLFGTQLQLGLRYRLPLHLLLLLFFIAPWWCSPELHQRSQIELELSIFAFPVVAALLFLGLVPAVHRGPAYADKNGSPWRWPWYPWPAFVFLMVAVVFRSFALAMTFGPSGPLWNELADGGQAISFDTIWEPYFLLPLALVVCLLVLEAGVVTKDQSTMKCSLALAVGFLPLALPFSDGTVSRNFLQHFTDTLASPLWLAVCLQVGFYAWAWYRGALGAELWLLGSFSLLTFVAPHSMNLQTLTSPQWWPLLIVGGSLLNLGVRRRSSGICLASALVMVFAIGVSLSGTPLAGWRVAICFHLLWGAIIVLGLVFRDALAEGLRGLGALMMPLAAVGLLSDFTTSIVPVWQKVVYLTLLSIVCLGIAVFSKSRWYWFGFGALMLCHLYAIVMTGSRTLSDLIGASALKALLWSTGSLLVAILISAHKANWLPIQRPDSSGSGSPPAGDLALSREMPGPEPSPPSASS